MFICLVVKEVRGSGKSSEKGLSEVVYCRTDNTLTKINKDKKTKNVPQNTTHDIKKIEQKEHHKEYGVLRKLSTKCSSNSINATRRFTIKRHEHHFIWKSFWTPVYVNQ